MNKGTRITLITIFILLIIGLLAYPKIKKSSGSKPKGAAGQPGGQGRQTLPVQIVVIQPASVSDKISTTGTLLPDEDVNLSFEASGKIIGLYFTEGTFVKKGTLLAKINDSRLQAQLQKLNNQLELSQSREYRQKALLDKDAISKESYDQAITELENYKADIALVKAQIAETELRAPFDGIIGLRQVSDGAYASPAVKIAKLSKISPLKLEFSVPQRFVSQVKKGTPITFSLDDLNTYHATVYAADAEIDEATRTIMVRALYPNTRSELMAGSFVNVSVQLSKVDNSIVVPAEALIPEMGKQIVYLYRDGKAEPVEVNIGIRTESDVQITKGLQMGDTVITTGILQLRKGLPVRIDQQNTPSHE